MRPEVPHQSLELASCSLKTIFNVGSLMSTILYLFLEFLCSCSQLIQFLLFPVQIFVADGLGAFPPELHGDRLHPIGCLLENIQTEQRSYCKGGLCDDFLALNGLVLTSSNIVGCLVRIHYEEIPKIPRQEFCDYTIHTGVVWLP